MGDEDLSVQWLRRVGQRLVGVDSGSEVGMTVDSEIPIRRTAAFAGPLRMRGWRIGMT